MLYGKNTTLAAARTALRNRYTCHSRGNRSSTLRVNTAALSSCTQEEIEERRDEEEEKECVGKSFQKYVCVRTVPRPYCPIIQSSSNNGGGQFFFFFFYVRATYSSVGRPPVGLLGRSWGQRYYRSNGSCHDYQFVLNNEDNNNNDDNYYQVLFAHISLSFLPAVTKVDEDKGDPKQQKETKVQRAKEKKKKSLEEKK